MSNFDKYFIPLLLEKILGLSILSLIEYIVCVCVLFAVWSLFFFLSLTLILTLAFCFFHTILPLYVYIGWLCVLYSLLCVMWLLCGIQRCTRENFHYNKFHHIIIFWSVYFIKSNLLISLECVCCCCCCLFSFYFIVISLLLSGCSLFLFIEQSSGSVILAAPCRVHVQYI